MSTSPTQGPTRTPIDLDTWVRREHFEHYRDVVPCTHATTVTLDWTALRAAAREAGRSTYLSQVWAVAHVVNEVDALRMHVADDGTPSTWQRLDPCFLVFDEERKTFAAIWTAYDDFPAFHDRAADLVARHARAGRMFPMGPPPPHCFDLSSLPWTAFTGFQLDVEGGHRHYLPILTLGRFVETTGRTTGPLALQVHHAAADGYHVGLFFQQLQDAVDRADTWLV